VSRVYDVIFPAMWLSWGAYWWLAARGSKPNVRREPLGSRLLHMLPLVLAVALLWPDNFPVALLNARLLRWTPWVFWSGALVTLAGLLFTVWARVHIARNWSGTVTIKQDHQLIESGPYALVRHPIYTGLLVAFIGSALARGEWRGLVAVVIVWLALWRKLGLEERWMLEIFGQRYEDYRRRVPALVPFTSGSGRGSAG
jgi:protein-S-isoprenylcysteine O-methyltransferase Ste14